MFVEDPIETIKSVCKHGENTITDNSFLVIYKKIKKIAEVGETKAETHLGTLRIYGIIEEDPNLPPGNNRLTDKGKILCKLLRTAHSESNPQFKNALANLLVKNQHKGRLFQEFLKFTTNRAKTVEEIKEKYQWRTGLTLISWCHAAGLIKKIGNNVIKIEKKRQKSKITLDKL